MSALRADYDAELANFRLAYSRAGCIVACVLVPGGVGLDLAFYPQYALPLGIARGLTTVLLCVLLALLYTRPARDYARGLTLTWLVLPQIMIVGMIYFTEGARSPYVFGLSLALYAAGIVLPIGLVQSLGLGTFTCLGYFVAGLLHDHSPVPHGALIGNTIFLLFSAIASAVCTVFNERARLKLFALQREVAEKNASLQSTNQALAQIKGHMMQQEKMAALGTLSAGLLHEVNNPVNYSMMALNMALMDKAVAVSADLKESLTDAKEGMQRVQSIVTDLKTFAYQKPGGDGNRIFLFEKAMQSALRLTGFELKGVEITTELPMDTHVLGDEPAIIGVLVNLLGNAGLALHKAAQAEPGRARQIRIHVAHVDGRLQVRVRDNGTGIPPANLSRVFEPFFTTREVGQGLGLGLAVCYAIVQRHGGLLAVESEEGAWTEFSFDLALATATTQARPQPQGDLA
ncbi:sensor histidine kinase [Pseudorhodoferax sp. Leaf267]|uniref:sensor histidine kinase n=1 Tax=Pseudorhodoferax sp. Leaf267 TaxID=1736316 RepID=UPI0006FC744F|nr:ATP-binding protein [Pseudorhodoferax sp. Leaf267]KQP12218.1 histidine kinase [Pseudorhodoferax sp. Leaf267]